MALVEGCHEAQVRMAFCHGPVPVVDLIRAHPTDNITRYRGGRSKGGAGSRRVVSGALGGRRGHATRFSQHGRECRTP